MFDAIKTICLVFGSYLVVGFILVIIFGIAFWMLEPERPKWIRNIPPIVVLGFVMFIAIYGLYGIFAADPMPYDYDPPAYDDPGIR